MLRRLKSAKLKFGAHLLDQHLTAKLNFKYETEIQCCSMYPIFIKKICEFAWTFYVF